MGCPAAILPKLAASNGGSNLLTEDLLIQASRRGQCQFEAIETLLKGKEIRVPNDDTRKTGEEWFASLRMDPESLTDPSARRRP